MTHDYILLPIIIVLCLLHFKWERRMWRREGRYEPELRDTIKQQLAGMEPDRTTCVEDAEGDLHYVKAWKDEVSGISIKKTRSLK